MSAFLVHKPGPHSSIQDAGRPGWRRYGIPVSGALDQFSFRVANLLVGNPPGAAALEITLPGLVLEALARVTVALTGADLGALWNGRPAPPGACFTLTPGDTLAFRRRHWGCRAYLAASGGFDAPAWLGSRSTFARGRMGAPLRAGEMLAAGVTSPRAASEPGISAHALRPMPQEFRIRVTLGPQDACFTARGRETFLGSAFRISPYSDRQGFRTEGPSLEIARGSDIISDPTPLGSVQVPADGKPIILHRDGQATGGYAKIARVISRDLDWFGQMVPGDRLRFENVTRDEALAIARQAEVEFLRIADFLKRGG